MRTILLAAVLAATASAQVSPGISPADAQEREIVSKLLASEKDSDRAWAAHLAANYGQARFVPDIVELLKSPEGRVRNAALDALIRLNADPPEEAMTGLIDAHPEHFNAVLILMGRIPRRHESFLTALLRREWDTGRWAALNAVLSRIPGTEQTSHLWSTWNMRVRILDRDAADVESGLCGDSAPPKPGEYPPSRAYSLYEPFRGELTAALVSRGPHPLQIGGADYCTILPDRPRHTRDYLELFAGSGSPSPEPSLRWVSAGTYRSDATLFLARLRESIAALRARLIGQKLLPPDAPPWPKIQVSDERTDKSTPLPAFDWVF